MQISSLLDSVRQLFQMMQAEESRIYWCRGTIREKWMEKRKKFVAAMAEIINKGVAEGKIRPDVRAEALASFLLGMLRTRARDQADFPEEMLRHELLVDLFCRGAGRGKHSEKQRNI